MLCGAEGDLIKWELFIVLEVHSDFGLIFIDKNFLLKKTDYVMSWDHLEVLKWLPELVSQERRKDLGGVLVEAECFIFTLALFTQVHSKLFRDD